MNLQYLINILREEGIARRFFVMNSFDGVLTVLGVITAMYLSGESDSRIILLSCFAPAVALMISGIWSAYAIEKAERALELRRLEKQMLVDLGETAIGKKLDTLVFMDSLINGLSPLIVSLVIIFPFILSHMEIIDLASAFLYALLLVLICLTLLGFFVGKVGGENMLKSGIKMLIAGVCVGLILVVLNSYVLPM